MDTLQYQGIREFTYLHSKLDAHLEELRINGFTILPDVIGDQTLEYLRLKVDETYRRQVAETQIYGDLDEINDANIARALLAYDHIFLELATQPIFLELLQKVLGEYFILSMQNAIINLPDKQNYQVSWHRDLNYQHFVSSRPLAVSIVVCLDDFSPQTGGTCVLPATHKIESFPSEQFVRKHEYNITAKAGSAIVIDSMLFHRAGHNSSDRARRGVTHVYCLPFIKQQISFPSLLKGKYAEDPFLRQFLGYESEHGASVTEWRARKFKKKAEKSSINYNEKENDICKDDPILARQSSTILH